MSLRPTLLYSSPETQPTTTKLRDAIIRLRGLILKEGTTFLGLHVLDIEVSITRNMLSNRLAII